MANRPLVIAGLSLSLVTVPLLRAQGPQQYSTINTDAVKKSIVFLLYKRDGGNTEVGTGFLVKIPVKNDPGHSYDVIITARHIVDPEWAGCNWKDPDSITVRVNAKDYKPGLSGTGVWELAFPLTYKGKRLWFSHPDDKVDAAVIPIISSPEIAEGKEVDIFNQDESELKLEDFATPQEIQKYKIGIGANVISAGLVPGLWNEKRNYPAFKFGKISNVMDEPVRMNCPPSGPQEDRLAWLIAGNFVPGNSGSPIFLQPLDFSLGPPLQFTGPRNMIIGILSGSLEGADLGEMVPIEYIFEIVEKNLPNSDLYRGEEKDRPSAASANQR